MVAIVPLPVGRREAHLRRGPPDVRPLQEARLRPLAPHSSLAHFIPSARDAVECRPQGLRQGYGGSGQGSGRGLGAVLVRAPRPGSQGAGGQPREAAKTSLLELL